MTPPLGFSPTTFEAFTPAHAAVAGAALTLILGSAVLGRRWRGTPRERVLRGVWAWSTIAWQGIALVWWLLPANFDPGDSLPLHLCDLAAWVAPLALLTGDTRLRALLYFWGVGLSTQAFFTPTLDEGYDTYEFWLFWVGHLQIVGSAVYDAAVLGYRPTFAHWWKVGLVNIAVVLGVILANQVLIPRAFGCLPTNYWYVGSELPTARTLLNALGPWPWRVVWLGLLAQTAQLLAWVPWGVLAARARSSAGRRPADSIAR